MMIVIVMAYDKSQDYDDDDSSSDTGGMKSMIFRSKNIFYNQHHDISHLLHLHDEVLMVGYDDNNDDDNNDDTYDHDNGDYD